MWIDYPAHIPEEVPTLLSHEKRLRGSRLADRVKMLRLLKAGLYRSHLQLVPVLGHSARTLRRWWRLYQHQGLTCLLSEPPSGGRPEQMTAPAQQALEEAMKQGQIGTLEQGRCFLKQHGVIYASVSGLSRWCKRHRIKLKTGRRRHAQASEEAQRAFKK